MVLLGGWAAGGARNAVESGALAYFSWLNARGGVYGRAISYKVLDDHGMTQTVTSLVHQLVQGDAVFAVFSPAAAQPNPALQFLGASGTPDVFGSQACPCANAPGRPAEVFGWSLGSLREGKVLGAWVARHFAGQKVGVWYGASQAGRAELAGFTDTAREVRLVAKILTAGPADAVARVAEMRKPGIKVVVALVPPRVTISLHAAMLAARLRVPLVAASSGIAAGLPNGVVTDGFLPSALAPATSAARSWIALFRLIKKTDLPRTPFSPALIDGMSAAYELSAALFAAGPDLTRPGLITALATIQPGPVLVPLSYTAADHGGPEGAYIGELRDGTIAPMAGAVITSDSATGPVTALPYAQPRAPADGVPPH